jgi:hypothetical protein
MAIVNNKKVSNFSRTKGGEFVELTKNSNTPDEKNRYFVYVDNSNNLSFWDGAEEIIRPVSDVYTATVNLTAALIKTLYSANSNKGIEIVKAPGANKFIEFLGAILVYTYDGTNAYTAANGLTFKLDTTAVAPTLANTFLQATAKRMANVQVLSANLNVDSADVYNKALYLQEGTQNPSGSSAVTTNQLVIKVAYKIHNLA